MTNEQIDKMGKDELRAACKAASIAYGKLNNGGMRDALKAKNSPAAAPVEVPTAPLAKTKPEVFDQAKLNAVKAPAPTQKVVAPKPAPAVKNDAPVASGKTAGLKIEKDREEKNGVKRPSIGGMCRAVWDYLDANQAATSKDVKAKAQEMGWNVNNASIELYQWRRFHGIRGRQTATK
jgi:hypothetical protein